MAGRLSDARPPFFRRARDQPFDYLCSESCLGVTLVQLMPLLDPQVRIILISI